MNRQNIRYQLEKKLDAGLSVHLVSLPSLGTSRWLRELKFENRKIVYLDAHSKIEELPVDSEIESEKAVTIVIDHFGVLLEQESTEFFNQLRALRDRFKYKLTYIAATTRYHDLVGWRAKLGGLFELVTEAKLYFPAMDFSETMKGIDTICQRLDCTIGEVEREKIWHYSGGIASLVKSQVLAFHEQAVVEGQLLERDKGIVDAIWQVLPETQQEVLKLLASGKQTGEDGLLRSWGLVEEGKILAEGLHWFVQGVSVSGSTKDVDEVVANSLTPIEYRLFEGLKSCSGQLCDRDTLVASGWPDDNAEGVSDEALDQAVSRLRRKLSGLGYEIRTMKGRGYLLQIES